MNFSRNAILILLSTILVAGIAVVGARADGVMRPVAKEYPKDFLRHRTTSIHVKLHGQIAITTIDEEFVNEWTDSTDGVFGFPLPADARTTDFLFWSGDSLFRAHLEVREQITNPGTGEGGVDALLNKYLGTNAIRVLIKKIPPGEAQRIQMQYISLCRHRAGKTVYEFPLATSDFETTPIEQLSVTIDADASDDISAMEFPGWSGATVSMSDSHHVRGTVEASKIYLTKDLRCNVVTTSTALGVDTYATMNDSLGGHFAAILRPNETPDSLMVLPKHVVFLLDRSTSMAPADLSACVRGIKASLDRLREGDSFNVMVYSYYVDQWRTGLVPVTPSAIDSAKTYLDGITPYGYSYLSYAMSTALAEFPADSANSMVILFSDGKVPMDPVAVRQGNTNKVGLFPIGIGTEVRRPMLDMLAYLNYGFPTYVPHAEDIQEEVEGLFNDLAKPVMRSTSLQWGAGVHDLLPRVPQSVYAGSRFFLTGKYETAQTSPISIGGVTAGGPASFNFSIDFPSVPGDQIFAEKFWAKEKIDEIERQIDVYGQTDSLKQLDITISLDYWMRCMFTAYMADKTIPVTPTGIDDATAVAFLRFNAAQESQGVTLRWEIQNPGLTRGVNIYRSMSMGGRYVRINAEPVLGGQYIDHDAAASTSWYKLETLIAGGGSAVTPAFTVGGGDTPDRFALVSNYPNPCNPSTTIHYSVPQRATVRLEVFTMLGQLVATLVEGEVEAGYHDVRFDGRNLASGAYVCRLTAGGSSHARKLLLLR